MGGESILFVQNDFDFVVTESEYRVKFVRRLELYGTQKPTIFFGETGNS